MRLYYFPEFWILLIACLYAGSSLFYTLYKMTKRDKELDVFLEKHLRPNVGRGTITKTTEVKVECTNCKIDNYITIKSGGDHEIVQSIKRRNEPEGPRRAL